MENYRKTREVIVRLLGNLASPKEIRQYLQRFSELESSRFAVVKVGGAILRDDLGDLVSSLTFLFRVGLTPIVLHGGGPQIEAALAAAGIADAKHNGLRVTTPKTLEVVHTVLKAENERLVAALNAYGSSAESIVTGVFRAQAMDTENLGRVGAITGIDLEPVRACTHAQRIPVLTCLAQDDSDELLNVNADMAANALVRASKPYKIVFVTQTGGLLDADGQVIPSLNLNSDYEQLMQQPWVHSGMRLKLQQIESLLADLSLSTSVSITRPDGLAKELFTHRGSGTLVRRGESIRTCAGWGDLDRERLRELIESSFGRALADDYFDTTVAFAVSVSSGYRAAAVLTEHDGLPHLDKFAVADAARGEGLGRAVWSQLRAAQPRLIWRCRPDNDINGFYFAEADGCLKGEHWNVYWYGLHDLAEVARHATRLNARPATLTETVA